MKSRLKNYKLKEQDEFIQSISLKKLRELNKNNKLIFQNRGEIIPIEEIENLELFSVDERIKNFQLSEFKKIFYNKQNPSKISSISITEKTKITGLDKNTILLIETKKEKATIEQIMVYCNKLHIPLQRLVPEFFISQY